MAVEMRLRLARTTRSRPSIWPRRQRSTPLASIDKRLVEIRRHRLADAETAGRVGDERGEALLPTARSSA
jgi:hypothetical protein